MLRKMAEVYRLLGFWGCLDLIGTHYVLFLFGSENYERIYNFFWKVMYKDEEK